MTPINNNQMSELREELKRILGQGETEEVILSMLLTLISHERAEAKAEARMELEVEVGLQKFGQLMKEKEKIRAEAELALLKSLNKEIVAKGEPDTFEVGRRYVLQYSERVKKLEEYLRGVNHE